MVDTRRHKSFRIHNAEIISIAPKLKCDTCIYMEKTKILISLNEKRLTLRTILKIP